MHRISIQCASLHRFENWTPDPVYVARFHPGAYNNSMPNLIPAINLKEGIHLVAYDLPSRQRLLLTAPLQAHHHDFALVQSGRVVWCRCLAPLHAVMRSSGSVPLFALAGTMLGLPCWVSVACSCMIGARPLTSNSAMVLHIN